jgi:serine/threonine protein kinase
LLLLLVSEEARDLIRQMLKAQPSDRISAKNALQHPWIIKYGSALSIESSATSNGKGMANKNGFHLAASDAPAASTCIVS